MSDQHWERYAESHSPCDRCGSTLVVRHTMTGQGQIGGEWLCAQCVRTLPPGSFRYVKVSV